MSKNSIAEIYRLLNIQIHLEKSVGSILNNIKKKTNVENLGETVIVLENTNELEQEYVQKAFQDIIESIKSKKKLLIQKNNYGNTDLRIFKNEMINLQNNIQDLKKHIKIKLSSLQHDAQSFEEDVNFYSEKLDDWCKKVEINQYDSIRSYKQHTSFLKHSVKEVQNFMDFVQKSNGHENAWRKEDHQVFIKFYKKYSNTETLAVKLNAVFPDISIEDIKIHIKWYKEYMLLKNQKENAIAKWKQSKKAEKLKYVNSEGAIGLKIVPYESSDIIKEMLQNFKMEKEKHLLSIRKKEEEKELEKKNKELLWKKRNEQLKRLVCEWKTTKMKMEEQELNRKKFNEEKEKKERATEANKLIKQFRSQDDMYIMKIREYKKRQKVRIPVRSKSSNTGSRNPDRLLKPTEQWINRVHDDTTYLNTSFSALPVKNLPKLGIPEWRKNIGIK